MGCQWRRRQFGAQSAGAKLRGRCFFFLSVSWLWFCVKDRAGYVDVLSFVLELVGSCSALVTKPRRLNMTNTQRIRSSCVELQKYRKKSTRPRKEIAPSFETGNFEGFVKFVSSACCVCRFEIAPLIVGGHKYHAVYLIWLFFQQFWDSRFWDYSIVGKGFEKLWFWMACAHHFVATM